MIKTYIDDIEVKPILQSCIDLFADGKVFHERIKLDVHLIGLQGAKRWHKHQSKKDDEKYKCLQAHFIDVLGLKIIPKWQYEHAEVTTVQEYLSSYLDWEIMVYKKLNIYTKKLIDLGLGFEGGLIMKSIETKEIEKIRRWTQDYSKSGWDWAYIRAKDDQLHTKCKNKYD